MADETLNLADLLDVPLSNFKDRPEFPPQKTFYGKLIGMTEGASEQKETPYYLFDVRLTDPGADVPASFTKTLNDSGFSLGDYKCGARFYLTPNAMLFFKRFLLSLGFDE